MQESGGAENVAMAMLAMAETLRLQQPPKYKMAIKCVRAAATLPITPAKMIYVQLQLGKLLLFYSENHEDARAILEQTYQLYVDTGEVFVSVRLETLILLCEAYIGGPHNVQSLHRVMALVRNELPSASYSQEITCKLLFYYIEAASLSGCIEQAVDACLSAAQTANDWGNTVMELYFRMTKVMLTARYLDAPVDDQDRTNIGSLMASLDPSSPNTSNLKLYFICTQLAYMLSDGKTRTSRVLLRSMQDDVQALAKEGSLGQSGIRWMEPVPLTVFACLMTIVVSTLQCNYDRAFKYYHVGMKHIQEYMSKVSRSPCEYTILRSVQRMRLAIQEMMAQCNIMACKTTNALDNIRDMVVYCNRLGPEISAEYGPSIQSLLGLYSVYLRDMDGAEKHFTSALRFKSSQEKDAWIMINVNLGLVYLLQCKQSQYYEVAGRLIPNRVNACSLIVKNNVRFLQAFHAFLLNKTQDCKSLTAECMEVAKAEDLFRLHGLAILLFSIPFPVALDVLQPTLNWSKKGHDHALHQWSNHAVARVLVARREDATPWIEAGQRERALLEKDSLVAEFNSHPAAGLLQWFDGDATPFLPKED